METQNAILSGFGLDGVLHLLQLIGSTLVPTEIPSVAEVMEAWRRGLLTDAEARKATHPNGCSWFPDNPQNAGGILGKSIGKAWQATAEMGIERPAPGELLELLRRRNIEEDEFEKTMRQSGWKNSDWLDWYRSLINEMPSISDLLHFDAKDVFFPEIVQKYGMWKEMRQEYVNIAERIGMNEEMMRFDYDGKDWDKPGASGIEGEKPVPLYMLHHFARWDMMSLTSAYDAYRRLRPGRVDRYKKIFPDIEPFTQRDLQLHLRVANMAPLSRDWLAALSYHTLTRVDVRRMHAVGVLTPDEVYEQYLDLGYNPEDAARLRDFTVKLNANTGQTADQKEAVKLTVQSFEIGALDEAPALAALKTAGLAETAAVLKVRNATARRRLKTAKSLIASVRKRFLNGHLTGLESHSMLLQAGFPVASADAYLRDWGIEQDTHRRELTTSQVLKLWSLGIIEEPTALQRLQNLGWAKIDAEYLIDLNAESERKAVEKKAYEPPYQREGAIAPYSGHPSASPQEVAPGAGSGEPIANP